MNIRYYELVLLARQDLTAGQVEGLVQQYTKTIKELGGDVKKTEFCGLRNTAYVIKKNKKCHYVLLNLEATPEIVKEIERQMSLNADIVRYLTIRVDKLDNTPSILMQKLSFKDGSKQDDHVEDEILTSIPEDEKGGE